MNTSARARALFDLSDRTAVVTGASSGIGRALMEHAIETLKVKGGTTVRLEADPPGIPLYRKLGFVDEFESCRLKLAASKQRPPVDRKAAEPMTTDDLHAVASLDNEIDWEQE